MLDRPADSVARLAIFLAQMWQRKHRPWLAVIRLFVLRPQPATYLFSPNIEIREKTTLANGVNRSELKIRKRAVCMHTQICISCMGIV